MPGTIKMFFLGEPAFYIHNGVLALTPLHAASVIFVCEQKRPLVEEKGGEGVTRCGKLIRVSKPMDMLVRGNDWHSARAMPPTLETQSFWSTKDREIRCAGGTRHYVRAVSLSYQVHGSTCSP